MKLVSIRFEIYSAFVSVSVYFSIATNLIAQSDALVAVNGPTLENKQRLENLEQVVHPFVLELRIIKASKPFDATVRKENKKINIDDGLSDLHDQLESLDFSKFTLLKVVQKKTAVKQKVVFSLCSKQTLTVRPLYRENGKVGLWLRWNDADGAPLLDTRMHIDSAHPILIGNPVNDDQTESGTGRVLALSLKR